MITRQHRHSRIQQLWLPILTAAFLGYFGFHAFSGSYGFFAMNSMELEVENLKAVLEKLKGERATLNRKVALLRADSLDADVVDLEARSSLNMLRPDEVVISFGASQHLLQ
jgi:cell division protein FtsB